MKDNIFSDLYDRVLSFFTSTQEKDESKILAKNRLRAVLMQDRVGFSERAMQMLKDDMLESISRYLEIDVNSFDLSIDAINDATVLNLSIPVLRPKTDEEIDEILSIEQKAKIEKTHEIVGEIQELVKEKAKELADEMTEDEENEQTEDEENQEEASIEDESKNEETQQTLDIPNEQDTSESQENEEQTVKKSSKKKKKKAK